MFTNTAAADDFDMVFLPCKETLPLQLSHLLSNQMLENPYFIQQILPTSKRKDEYLCDNCNKELFYSDSNDKTCINCNQEINHETFQNMQIKMNEYQTAMQQPQNPINNAIKTCLQKVISLDAIELIQDFVRCSHVKYHVLMFGNDVETVKNGHYIGDKRALQIGLNKLKNKLQFGDVITVDAYGPHFVAFNDANQPKLIINPCYNGYRRISSVNTLCVPVEITDNIEMDDFFNFYRLRFINLFRANGCSKVKYFPVSMAAVSYSKLYTLKEQLWLPTHIFTVPNNTIFYLQSKNFSYIDTLYFVLDEDLITVSIDNSCTDFISKKLFEIGQQRLSLALKKHEILKKMQMEKNENTTLNIN